MDNTLLLVPDFLLILCGFVLCRYTALDRGLWDGVERLVYYVLFPVLLFNSIVKTPLDPGAAIEVVLCGWGITLAGVAAAYALRLWPKVDARLHASGAQTAFRFNSFIGFALAERIGGPQGVAVVALLIAVCVPVCNLAAVWPLARHGGQTFGREIARNPLIIATVAGLLANVAGLHWPEPVATALQRIGLAALPLGLMAVGAGLRMGELRIAPGLAAALLAIRHAALPLAAIALTALLALSPLQRAVVVAFASLPTSSASYVLAARMGGNGPFVAGLVMVSTILCVATIPLWLAVLAMLQ
ncbi:MAG: AEC family transporter [Burkholderiaceae bacterium]|nr:AEC family transporter [Burkholderiaceae bacterium]